MKRFILMIITIFFFIVSLNVLFIKCSKDTSHKNTSHVESAKKSIKPPAHILTPYSKSFLDSSFVAKSQEMGIKIGTTSDELLRIRGKPSIPSEILSRDANGLVVKWQYPNGYYILRMREKNGITCYRITEMRSH